MFTIDMRSGVPIFEQIRDSIRRLILTGVWPAGSQIPSVRELAVSLCINPNTVARAFRELEQDGWICTVKGKGSFVSPDTDRGAGLQRSEAESRLEAVIRELLELKVSPGEIHEMVRRLTQ